MSNTDQPQIDGIHKWPLFGAFGVAVLTLVLVAGSVMIGLEPVGAKKAPAITERSLLFRDGANGQVKVYDAQSRQHLDSFSKGEGAFVRISMRGMTRQRISRELDVMSPYRLVKTTNGDLFIVDPLSDHKIRVNAFGPVAIKSFSRFLERDYSTKGAKE